MKEPHAGLIKRAAAERDGPPAAAPPSAPPDMRNTCAQLNLTAFPAQVIPVTLERPASRGGDRGLDGAECGRHGNARPIEDAGRSRLPSDAPGRPARSRAVTHGENGGIIPPRRMQL